MELDDHITKKYDIKKRLGKGAYGIVWKAVDRKTKEVVALKKIFDAFQNQVDAQRTYREIMFLKAFGSHPNIIKLQGVHKASNNKDIYLVFDYMDTDLHKVIQSKNILKDIHKRFIMYQLLRATMYMHSGNVIHRDQKPSNILLDTNCQCKIADFGLARSLSQLSDECSAGGDPPLTDYVATRWYRAPEILIGSTRYTKGIDMWSLGCILAEMLLEKPLFPGGSSLKQLELITRSLPPPSPEDVRLLVHTYGGSKLFAAHGPGSRKHPSLREILSAAQAPTDAIDMVEKLLVLNPQRRLTAADALKHPYVAKFHNLDSELSLRQAVLPPLSDNTMLTVEEYRNKLYELASGHHQTHSAPSSRRNSHKQSGGSPAVGAASTSAGARRTQPRQSRHASLEEKTRGGGKHGSRASLAPPADWQDRRASLPKKLSQQQQQSQQQQAATATEMEKKGVKINQAERKTSLPVLPQNSQQPQPQPAPDRAKLVSLTSKQHQFCHNHSIRRQFDNKSNHGTWSGVGGGGGGQVHQLRQDCAILTMQALLPHLV